ncbi:MAG: tripartite tricarboxylate transporter substrate binding protein, partial [Caldimonas sp.]
MNLRSRIAAPRALVRCAAAILLGGLAGVALAQGSGPWPNRPIRIVIPYAAGSSPDVFARIVAEKIAPRLGQPVLV